MLSPVAGLGSARQASARAWNHEARMHQSSLVTSLGWDVLATAGVPAGGSAGGAQSARGGSSPSSSHPSTGAMRSSLLSYSPSSSRSSLLIHGGRVCRCGRRRCSRLERGHPRFHGFPRCGVQNSRHSWMAGHSPRTFAVAVSPGLVYELRVLVPIPGRVEDLGVGTFTSGMLLPHWHHPSVSPVKSSSVRTT